MNDKETKTLLTLLQRVIASSDDESVRRVANSLFTLLSKDYFSNKIEF